jgi:HEAT repeat protein
MEDLDITDVMVAGDFVTLGLQKASLWEERLDEILARVTELFWTGEASSGPARTREELLDEAGRLSTAPARAEDLHLMDPDVADHREMLIEALGSDDPRRRRAAVVTLALSGQVEVARAALVTGYRDESRLVRRAAVDAAADLESEDYRSLFEEALNDPDSWIRWRAVRAIADIGVGPSRDKIALAAADENFRVRFEAAATFRLED